MGKSVREHGLSETPFMSDLRIGVLGPLLQLVQKDTSLDMEIRCECLNVYYRGGSILRVTGTGNGYTVFFDPEYAETPLQLPNDLITTVPDTQAWLCPNSNFEEHNGPLFRRSSRE